MPGGDIRAGELGNTSRLSGRKPTEWSISGCLGRVLPAGIEREKWSIFYEFNYETASIYAAPGLDRPSHYQIIAYVRVSRYVSASSIIKPQRAQGDCPDPEFV